LRPFPSDESRRLRWGSRVRAEAFFKNAPLSRGGTLSGVRFSPLADQVFLGMIMARSCSCRLSHPAQGGAVFLAHQGGEFARTSLSDPFGAMTVIFLQDACAPKEGGEHFYMHGIRSPLCRAIFPCIRPVPSVQEIVPLVNRYPPAGRTSLTGPWVLLFFKKSRLLPPSVSHDKRWSLVELPDLSFLGNHPFLSVTKTCSPPPQ